MKIICVGLNYRQHADELKWEAPDKPVLFMKPDSALLKNNKPFFLPDFSKDIHYEVEVVVKICRLGKGISAKFAHRYFDEVTLGIDITARDLQAEVRKNSLPWEITKGFDGAAPVGKLLPVTGFSDINNLNFRLEINGKTVQKGNTADMIFSIAEIIEYASIFFTLKTGDLIFTGTPPGVGPLKRNDRLIAYLEEIPVLDFIVK
ncbi:MAG TPA: fumarylacetoacetate hydrolase family protein [Bacteroidales bacterium]|nr:fumarylacetoacetate hydrolase family protein [Bacteroidales bacterium]HQG35764.1 fumarylacetoacetate hydrolase family protein [Bacteroidales bacterium]HQG52322.1 fumarylacetoacetate hydrolase family protein [Bacteroidales bacterium]HQJ19818.1 fumarylacetoacetate hydrolase family protein [Bacteroidales bacterium]